MSRKTGRYRVSESHGETVRAFIPHPLPPARPRLSVEGELAASLSAAHTALAKLDVAGAMIPSTDWFLYGFVRKEAVMSSQIEGTQATLRDVLTFEATHQSARPDDVEEVCNYVEALTYVFEQLRDSKGLPLSMRLLCNAHRILMRGVRGRDQRPGEVRSSQNWIGGTRPGDALFVPPPPEDVSDALTELEKWLHSDDSLPALVRVGLAHVQFETNHPFLDGNGRIGRLLIALLIAHWDLLDRPLLYLSVALRRRREEYYDRLTAVRTDGDWEGWTSFFLECVREAAEDGVRIAQSLHALLGTDRRRLFENQRVTVAALQLLDLLPQHPVVTVTRAADVLGTTPPTARKSIDLLSDLNILRETTGKQRDRVYAYQAYMRILTGEEG